MYQTNTVHSCIRLKGGIYVSDEKGPSMYQPKTIIDVIEEESFMYQTNIDHLYITLKWTTYVSG